MKAKRIIDLLSSSTPSVLERKDKFQPFWTQISRRYRESHADLLRTCRINHYCLPKILVADKELLHRMSLVTLPVKQNTKTKILKITLVVPIRKLTFKSIRDNLNNDLENDGKSVDNSRVWHPSVKGSAKFVEI